MRKINQVSFVECSFGEKVWSTNTVIFQKEKGGGTYENHWYARLPIVEVDRNKNVTLNRCP
jgi:hypothetical protein